MKKNIVFLALITGLCLCAFAQEQKEKKFDIGLGAEWNMDSRYDFAGGAALDVIYNLPGSSALGLACTASYNFKDTGSPIYVFEPAFLVRHYFFSGMYSGLFLQFDLGAFISLEEKGITPMIMSGLSAGFRLPLGSFFYIEPYGRLGYPFAFGLGAMAGISF
jgi:hypothetical protein